MHYITEELQGLEELYIDLESRLEKQYQELLAHRFPDDEENGDAAALECRILEAEKHLAKLWSPGSLPASSSPMERRDISSYTAPLKKHAQHLLDLLGRNAAQCVRLQSAAQASLRELQRGGRYLQSIRGYRENQPKFLDSSQ